MCCYDPKNIESLIAFTALTSLSCYRGTDKSLARPGRKQARKHVKNARDFNKIEIRAVIKVSFPARQGAEGNSRHSDRNISFLNFIFMGPCVLNQI